jgi:hypothetical protein
MNNKLIPYYASRGVLAALFGWFFSLSAGPWIGVLAGALVYAGFLWYAHSGRYVVDTSNPLFPLRRDERAKAIRDRATVTAVGVGALAFLGLSLVAWALRLEYQAGAWAVAAGVATYFVVSNWLFARS